MPIHPDFPRDPYVVIDPSMRWYPGTDDLSEADAHKLIPPLVAEIRKGVDNWRASGYEDVSETSRALLNHWFNITHLVDGPDGEQSEFRYYFAQREAVETAVWLYEHENARDPYSLLRFDATGAVAQGMFAEIWTRYVFKLATGAGKTKVLSMLIAWAYFHRRYEQESQLSTNFLLIAPNIIVLDRLLDDFDGLKIFSNDPVVPSNGYAGRNWQSDFQMTLHVQDEVGVVAPEGNLFLTNVHRIYGGGAAPSPEDEDLTNYLLGNKPVAKTTRPFNLSDVVHRVSDLVILNDEAHHIHDERLAWFRAIETIDNQMRQRTGHGIAAQFDVTATPKDQKGAIFVQTVCSYPLVEAIRQGVVKTPVVPDEASRAKLQEHTSDKTSERYADHLKLGYLEWAKRRDDLVATGKKPVLFIMTTTTPEADEVADYMERTYSDLTDKVLVIHTKANGEVSAKVGSDELEQLRLESRMIDSTESKYVCVVSVLMLREGWDVQNVISMVGLRPYDAESKILPEQTLGRGLRRMFRGDPELTEYVSIVGTDQFLDFVESIRSEGVELEKVSMGGDTTPKKPLLIEVDRNNPDKDVEGLDIPIPRLSRRIQRQTKNLEELNAGSLERGDFEIIQFSPEEQREIVFRDLDKDEAAWRTDLGREITPTPQAVIAYLTREIMRRLRLVSGRDILYGKVKEYISDGLFDTAVNPDDLNVLRNLSEPGVRLHLLNVFADAVNQLTLSDVGATEVVTEIKISKTRPTVVNQQEYLESKKTLFNKVVGDSHLELRFASFLDRAPDTIAFVKNARGIHFFIEYVNASGEIAHYYPDFLVQTSNEQVYVVEAKGLEDIDVAPKWHRLVLWCEDASELDPRGRTFTPLFLAESVFDDIEGSLSSMQQLAEIIASHAPTGA